MPATGEWRSATSGVALTSIPAFQDELAYISGGQIKVCSALSTTKDITIVVFRIKVSNIYSSVILVELDRFGAITHANIPNDLGGHGGISGADLGILGINIIDVSGGAPYTVCVKLPYKANILGTAQTLTLRVDLEVFAVGSVRGSQEYKLVLVSVFPEKKRCCQPGPGWCCPYLLTCTSLLVAGIVSHTEL